MNFFKDIIINIKKTEIIINYAKRMKKTKITIAIIFIISLIIIHIYDLKTSLNLYNFELLKSNHPLASIVIFVLLYSVAVIGFIPTLPLNLVAGIFWGGIIGGILSALGVAIGGAGSFLLARYFVTEKINFVNKKIKKFGFNIETDVSWTVLGILRINPIIPTSIINYLLGCTKVSFMKYFVSTLIFILPASIIVAYLGEIFQTITKDNNVEKILIKLYLLSAFIIILYCLKKYFKNTNHENNTISNDFK